MRILHIINTLEFGGAQSVLYQLLSGWQENTDQHKVISLKEPGHLSNKVEALDISLVHLGAKSGRFNLGWFLHLLREIHSFRPDVIQTWLYHSDLVGSLAARLVSRAPIVWGVHHTTSTATSVKSSTWQVVRVLSALSSYLPAKIICCSKSAFDAHWGLGYPRQKMILIENGINTDQFKPDSGAGALLRRELGLSNEIKLIGMFARYHPQKDFSTLIRAAGILRKKAPNVHFVLAGSGVDAFNGELVEMISEQKVESKIHLLGERTDMPFLAASIDFLTLSASFGEAMPQAVAEAMACGAPCVVTDVGDMVSLVGETGWVVPSTDAKALADALVSASRLSKTQYLAKSNAARGRILKKFNINDMISQYHGVYQSVCK